MKSGARLAGAEWGNYQRLSVTAARADFIGNVGTLLGDLDDSAVCRADRLRCRDGRRGARRLRGERAADERADLLSRHGAARRDGGRYRRGVDDLRLSQQQRSRRRRRRSRTDALCRRAGACHGGARQDGSRCRPAVRRSASATAGLAGSVAVENISAGYHTLAEAFSGWRDSPPHRANMLNRGVTRLGIAAVYAPSFEVQGILGAGAGGARAAWVAVGRMGMASGEWGRSE